MPYILLLIGCISLFLSSLGLSITSLQHFDFLSVVWISSHRLTFLNGLMTTLSHLGGLPPMIVIVGLLSLLFMQRKQYTNLIMVNIGLFGAAAIGWIVKYLVNRPRPDEVFQMVQTYGASFPSAHSIYATVLACSLMFILNKHQQIKWIRLVACFWILIMGISRVYLGAHFPIDVLAGWGIGFVWAALLWFILSPKTLSRNKFLLDKNLNEVE